MAKIAVVSNDGQSFSMHFGQAAFYVVYSVSDGQVAGREVRSKAFHRVANALGQAHNHGESGHHGHDHGPMISPIADCKILVAGGMGAGAYNSLRASGIEPAFVQARTADEAIAAYLAGEIVDHPLCHH